MWVSVVIQLFCQILLFCVSPTLFKSYIYLFGRSAEMEEIYYFSALAKHLEAYQPDVTNRHRLYLECLASTGLLIKLHKFQKGSIRCLHCDQRFNRYEEKETDVAIAVKVLFSTGHMTKLGVWSFD